MGTAIAATDAGRSTATKPDGQLVAAVRRGDDRAFEELYGRYQRRIAAYVYGMVNDYGRAEDITQDVFISALRRMRETERPIAFKPWIYEIAKNACIDAFRRSRRAEEVSYDAEEGLGAADYGRLASTGPSPDVAVDTKQQLDHLRGAFGGLSETHHEILVLREMEGLSYREIGDRMGMSRPAVESTLFRARRRLTEEYDELVSGQRCIRIQGIIGTAAEGMLGARDQRKLARHVAHCQPCRRQATMAGLDTATLRRIPARQRIAAKVGAWLPIPAFLRKGPSDSVAALAGGQGPNVASWMPTLTSFSEPLSTGLGKAAAAAAVVIAGLGAGVGTRELVTEDTPPRPAAATAPASSGSGGAAKSAKSGGVSGNATTGTVTSRTRRGSGSGSGSGGSSTRSGGSSAGGTTTAGGTTGGGTGAKAPSGDSGAGAATPLTGTPSTPSLPTDTVSDPGTGTGAPSTTLPETPAAELPITAPTDPAQTIDDTVRGVEQGAADAGKGLTEGLGGLGGG